MKRHLLLISVCAFLNAPEAMAFVPGDTLAYVIHGNDRTLAAVEKPAGPVHFNLAVTGVFPNDLVLRGARACVTASGSDAVYMYDLAGCAPVDTIPTGPGTNPYALAFVSDTRAYVTLLVTNEVAEIDLGTGAVVATIPVGTSPAGIVYAGGRLFVANSGFDFNTYGYEPGTISVIDPGTNTVTHTLPVGLNPQALAVTPAGEVHVCCTGDYFSVFGRAFMIDPVTATVTDSLDVGGSPGFLAIDTDGDAYLSDYFLGLLKYHAPSRTLLRDASNPIFVGTGAAGVAFCDGNAWACVFGDDNLVILDAADNVLDVIAMGDGPQDIAFHAAEAPIAVRLASFTVEADGEAARLSWRTTDEVDHAGFHVDRSADGGNSWMRLTGDLLRGDGTGLYSWTDLYTSDASPTSRPGTAAEASDVRSSLFYRLAAVDRAGREETFAPIQFLIPAGPGAARLDPPFPNPVTTAGTRISFRTATPGPVTLTLFDAAGREVARLLDATLPAGSHAVTWSGQNDSGRRPGVYFMRLAAGDVVRTGRIVVAR